MWWSRPWFLHFAVPGRLGRPQLSDVKNGTALNILVPVFGEHLHGFLLDNTEKWD